MTQSVAVELESMFETKDDDARVAIASRVGQWLTNDDLSDAERRAVEALADRLVRDVVEQVRSALAAAVRNATDLPREIALRIAHDIDDIACPFLEVTTVFTDRDWQGLVLTISRAARIAVARRSSMTEALALALAEVGEPLVGETLVENPMAELTDNVCLKLIDRFSAETWILDKLAEHARLPQVVVSTLIGRISAAARARLEARYAAPALTDAVVDDAELATLLKLIAETPTPSVAELAERLRKDGMLSPRLLIEALRAGYVGFLEAALAAISGLRTAQVRSTIAHAGSGPTKKLFQQAKIPEALHEDFWSAVLRVREPAARSGRAPADVA